MNFAYWTGFVVLSFSFYIIWKVRQLLILLFTAVVISNFLNHGVQTLQRFGIKRFYSVLLLITFSLIILLKFFLYIFYPSSEQFPELFLLVSQGIDRLTSPIHEFTMQLDPDLTKTFPSLDRIIEQLHPLFQRIAGQGLSVFYTTLGIPLTFLLLLILSLMLLVNPTAYRQGFIRLFPFFYRSRIDSALRKCDLFLKGELLALLFRMIIIFVLAFTGLSILKIPLSFTQALLIMILNLFPNIGPILSFIPPMAIASLETPLKSLIVLVIFILFYLTIRQIENRIITPLIIKSRISLPPGFILLSQVFFATFFGILGFLLATPLTIIISVLVKEIIVGDILDKWNSSYFLK
ncbi:AI-2E family transporter [Candidatus Atelocyanobacterium thalassae]|uniref:AI-2E family transporter n=1 Tax=cyanobacterium endosymbiont of Braarudosphaera bigelowii TaxID=1285375 RepID=A0ABM7U3M2_9CHRO|nr:AI-2E family transporter [Candidatus Atelocyanobacterium thalassa]BDA39303.1 hypothetical protein CPARK_000014200 [cyanobacterium endosymbiont of Braarudosphaera bigelowii]